MTAQTATVKEVRAQLVVFDMAGTTVYDGDAVHECLAQALETAGVQASRDEINTVMGIAKPLAIRTLLEKRQREQDAVTPALVHRVHEDFLQRMQTHYETSLNVREIEGAAETFQSLRAAGIKVALDTGFDRATVQTILRRLNWNSDLLDATAASDEVANGRPHPDMIFRLMLLTGVEDVATVAKVGDTPSDLQEGQAAGCGWIIGVTNGSHTAAELQPHPHTHLVASVKDVPGLLL